VLARHRVDAALVFDDGDSGNERGYIGDADSVRNIMEGDGASGKGAGFGGF
jgi:hypothetical protein